MSVRGASESWLTLSPLVCDPRSIPLKTGEANVTTALHNGMRIRSGVMITRSAFPLLVQDAGLLSWYIDIRDGGSSTTRLGDT